ncbi:hypothetical protein VTI74DRAFT_7580 [Chaetomium olivicolor]
MRLLRSSSPFTFHQTQLFFGELRGRHKVPLLRGCSGSLAASYRSPRGFRPGVSFVAHQPLPGGKTQPAVVGQNTTARLRPSVTQAGVPCLDLSTIPCSRRRMPCAGFSHKTSPIGLAHRLPMATRPGCRHVCGGNGVHGAPSADLEIQGFGRVSSEASAMAGLGERKWTNGAGCFWKQTLNVSWVSN